MLALLLEVAAHVPTYGAGTCQTPPHIHTTSQVIYLKSTGGLEIHFSSLTSPFNITGNEVLDIDAVFKSKYDQSTYSLYVGCGGCVSYVDPIVIDPVALSGYTAGELEPFTQTAYFSVFNKTERKYNSSQLETCDQGHFTIRLIDHHNRTDNSTLIWGAVIGLGETFTPLELISFPSYVLMNHAGVWNQLGWTWWLILPLSVPLWWSLRVGVRWAFGWRWLSPFDLSMTLNPRAWLYDLSLIAFLAATLEQLVHLFYAQSFVPVGAQFAVGFLVILLSNGLPACITCIVWWGMYHIDEGWTISNAWWWVLEIITAASWLFFFGAGFYLAPLFLAVASIFRAFELLDVAPYSARLDKLYSTAGITQDTRKPYTDDQSRRPMLPMPRGAQQKQKQWPIYRGNTYESGTMPQILR